MAGSINVYLFAAAVLIILTALVHSVMGERLIFARWRRKTPDIPNGYIGIIWASWHVLSVFGLMIAAVVAFYAIGLMPMSSALLRAFATLFVVSSALIAWGTKWQHPAWAVFLILAILMLIA